MLRDSRGYLYESLAHRLKGEKAPGTRNALLDAHYRRGDTPQEIRAWIERFDRCPFDPENPDEGFDPEVSARYERYYDEGADDPDDPCPF